MVYCPREFDLNGYFALVVLSAAGLWLAIGTPGDELIFCLLVSNYRYITEG